MNVCVPWGVQTRLKNFSFLISFVQISNVTLEASGGGVQTLQSSRGLAPTRHWSQATAIGSEPAGYCHPRKSCCVDVFRLTARVSVDGTVGVLMSDVSWLSRRKSATPVDN